MGAVFKKQNGQILVKPVEGPVLLRKRFRIVNGRRTDYAQWLTGANQVWFAIRNINMQMLYHDQEEDRFYGDTGEDDARSEWVACQGIVFLLIARATQDQKAYLMNQESKCLAGSNIMVDDLCLGESFNPYSERALELLLYNNANHDLAWRGDVLRGEWKDGPEDNYFSITTWPTISRCQYNIPPEILDATKRWWPE